MTTAQLPNGQMLSGYSFGEIISLPPRVKTLENSLNQNWTDHNGIKNSLNFFSNQWFNLVVSTNDLQSRVSGLEAGKAVPGGGQAGLTGAQTSDLAFLHTYRQNIANLLNTPALDVKAQLHGLLSSGDHQTITDLRDIMGNLINSNSSVRTNLSNFNYSWWATNVNSLIGNSVTPDYLRGLLDNFYSSYDYINKLQNTIYNDKNSGINPINNRLAFVEQKVPGYDRTSTKMSNLKDNMNCLKTQMDNFKKAVDGFRIDARAWADDMATGGGDGIRPGHIGTVVENISGGLSQWMNSFINDVIPNLDQMFLSLQNVVNCLAQTVDNLNK